MPLGMRSKNSKQEGGYHGSELERREWEDLAIHRNKVGQGTGKTTGAGDPGEWETPRGSGIVDLLGTFQRLTRVCASAFKSGERVFKE